MHPWPATISLLPIFLPCAGFIHISAHRWKYLSFSTALGLSSHCLASWFSNLGSHMHYLPATIFWPSSFLLCAVFGHISAHRWKYLPFSTAIGSSPHCLASWFSNLGSHMHYLPATIFLSLTFLPRAVLAISRPTDGNTYHFQLL